MAEARRRVMRSRPRRGVEPAETEAGTSMGTAEHRRNLRSKYRALKVSFADEKEQHVRVTSSKFDDLVGQMESLHELVEKPREQIADAELFLDITNELLEVAKGARSKDGMSPAEFVGAIMHNFGGNSVNWQALGMIASSIFSDAPGISTMIGPLNTEPRQRKVVERRNRDRLGEKTHVQQVKEGDQADKRGETDVNMVTMFNILKGHPNVPLDRLVLNRKSFAQTVENIFCLSFLAKDGRAEIRIDGKNHVVASKNAPSHEERGRGNGLVHNTQFVFRFDFRDWMFMKESVPEGYELMPHRTKEDEDAVMRTPPIRKTSRNRGREVPVCELPGVEEEEESFERRSKRPLLMRS